MKKLVCGLLCICMLLGMAACGKSEEKLRNEAIVAADAIFEKASGKKVEYKSELDEYEDETYYRVDAIFSDKFEDADEIREYAEEDIIDGPYAQAKEILDEVGLKIFIVCIDDDGNELFYIYKKKCKDIEEKEEETVTDTSASAEEPEGDFPVADYGGDDFTFLILDQNEMSGKYNGGYIDADSLCGEQINDMVYERNAAVENKYNVNITTKVEGNCDPKEILNSYFMSGDISFDVINAAGSKLGACITEGYFSDFNNLSNTDYTKEYWMPSTIEDLTVAGKQYISMNDISMNSLNCSSCFLYNQKLGEDYEVETAYASPYEMVVNGTWTYDVFLGMIRSVSNDINGDGKMTKDDVYGMIHGSAVGVGALNNCGVFYTTETDTGFELSLWSEKAYGILEMVEKVYSDGKYVISYDSIINGADTSGYDDQYQYARSFFANDHALFLSATPDNLTESSIFNMESEYLILPPPKYDEAQENYISTISMNAYVFAIPSMKSSNDSTSADFERTGIILEYMAYISNRLLLPAYYESLTNNRPDIAAEQTEMLKLIRNNVRYEISDIFGFSLVSETAYSMAQNPSASYSRYLVNENKMINELDTFYSEVLGLK